MPYTTIKVDSIVRDRLADRGRVHGRSAGDELAAILDRVEALERWSRAAANHASLPPEARAELRQHEQLAFHQVAMDTHGQPG